MISVAKETKDGCVLNGAKMWITNGSTAQIAIVWAKTGRVDDVESIRGFIVPTNTKGFSAKDQKGKLSLRASDTSELVLQDVCVPKDALLPKSGGLKSPLLCLTQARYGIAWGAVGAAMACYDEAVSYAKTRVMFGKPIGGFQLQQARLAEMLTEITKAQLLSLQLGRLKDQGKVTPQQVSLAKRNNVSIATDMARETRRLLGANGILAEDHAMRHLANLESVYTYEGTHDIHTLILGQDERVDVVRPLIRINRLEVREVAHRLILRQDAVRAQQPARLTRHVCRDAHVVPLGERHLLRRDLPLVLEPPQLQAEELCLGDLREHLGEPRLLQLEAADRLAEHHARLCVAQRLVVARHCRAHRSPRDAIARLREAQKRRLEPARLREQGVLGDAHVLQHQLARVAGAQAELAFLVFGREPVGAGRNDEAADRVHVVDLAGLGPHDGQLRGGAVGDPHLGPVQDPAILRLLRHGDHVGGIRSVVRLREPEAADHLARRHLREPAPLLLVRPEGVDRIHGQRALDRGERAHPRVAALELLHDEAVGDVVQPGAAVLLREVGAEQAKLRHLRNELLREAPLDVVLADDGDQVLVHPRAHRVAHGALFLGEQTVDVVEVDALKLGCHGCLSCGMSSPP